MYRYAVDCSSWTGVLTPDDAHAIKNMGFQKAIVNLWCDGLRYDSQGFRDNNGKTTVEWQVDAFTEAQFEVDGYIYYYFIEDGPTRAGRLLRNLNGRHINFIWDDWEDDEYQLTVQDTIDYIHAVKNFWVGQLWSGHYTRREWWMRRTGNSKDFAGHPLWDATNDHSPDLSWNPYGDFRHYMEQYAFDTALVPGRGLFDLNVYWEAEAGDPDPDEPVEPDPGDFPTLDPVKYTSLQAAIQALKIQGNGVHEQTANLQNFIALVEAKANELGA